MLSNIKVSYCEGCRVLIEDVDSDYLILIKEGDRVLLSTNSNYAKYDSYFFVDFSVEVWKNSELVFFDKIDLTGKKVKINFDTGALGDNISFISQVDNFQKKWNCQVYLNSIHKEIFDYDNLKFEEAQIVYNSDKSIITGLESLSCRNFFCFHDFCSCYYASYTLGYYTTPEYRIFEKEHPKLNPIDLPLSRVAANILGIDYIETKAKIRIESKKNEQKNKYVCISVHSTRQYKYWNNPNGWNEIVKYIKTLGYDVVCIDKMSVVENSGFVNKIPIGCIDKTGDLPLQNRISDIFNCEFFIGLGSGLSWLAWSLDKPVILISGFSNPISEFYTPFRVFNDKVCNSCWNDKNIFHPKNDWSFCPREKDFECSKEIKSEMVKLKIREIIDGKKC